ncbi:MAG TPA: head decoration protein [Clostridia bacterium]|nr:head decoration protein [Clostridia bacterium]
MSREGIGSYQVLATNTPDKLIAGQDIPILTEGITLLKGQVALLRGSVIGLISAAAGDVTADAENTGDGTVTGFSIGKDAKIGNYLIQCTAVAANAGTFAVYAPDGTRLKDAAVGEAYVSTQINFTINDGETQDFIVGDKFTLPVAAGGKGKLCDANSVDGSQTAKYILAEESIDTTAEDVVATCYKTGTFNRNALIFGTNGAPATLDADLRDVGIHLRDEISY